ncbi:hypothetical protein VCHA29O37_140022 [Vibrio chagasii]|nr:hypothetical protein VCHA29O37_140022 [Vibrio chagasii]
MLEKEQYSSDKLKDIGAYISTDCFLSFLTLGIAVTPGLLITQFMF